MPKKYAEKTSITIERSKGDISKLLRDWKCDRIAWEEDFENGHIALLFVWKKDTQPYAARLEIKIPTEAQIRERPECVSRVTGQANEGAVRKGIESAGRAEMRLLLLWLRAAFAAIDEGIIGADVIFMPFFVVRDGQTVADVVRPNLPALISGKTSFKQLTSG